MKGWTGGQRAETWEWSDGVCLLKRGQVLLASGASFDLGDTREKVASSTAEAASGICFGGFTLVTPCMQGSVLSAVATEQG